MVILYNVTNKHDTKSINKLLTDMIIVVSGKLNYTFVASVYVGHVSEFSRVYIQGGSI